MFEPVTSSIRNKKGSSDGVGTFYGLNNQGLFPAEYDFTLQCLDQFYGPSSFHIYRRLFQGVKWPYREANLSYPSNSKINSYGAIWPVAHMTSWRGN
jgi:hypothetical protein